MDAPKSLYAASQLSPMARLLGALLWTYANRDDGGEPFVWPLASRLALEMATTERTIRRASLELEEAGFARKDTREKYGRPTLGWLLTSGQTDPQVGQKDPRRGQTDPGGRILLTESRTNGSTIADPFDRRNDEETGTGAQQDATKRKIVPAGTSIKPPSNLQRESAPLRVIEGGSTRIRAGRQGGWQAGKPSTVDELLREPIGQEWIRKYPQLDGRGDRPTLEVTCKSLWPTLEKWTWPEPCASKLTVILSDIASKHRFSWQRDGSPLATASVSQGPAPIGEDEVAPGVARVS